MQLPDIPLNLDYFREQLLFKKYSPKVMARIQDFIDILEKDVVNLDALKQLSYQGIPDDLIGLRPLCWKLLIGLLPPQRGQWVSYTNKNCKLYTEFCKEFLKVQLNNENLNWLKSCNDDVLEDFHKKLNNQTPQHKEWIEFFNNQQIWDEVEKDTFRTRSELNFFMSDQQKNIVEYPNYFKTFLRKERERDNNLKQKHYDVLTRILFVYAKLNPSIRYVQGMNEILAPFYYVFNTDHNQFFNSCVESDAFFSFTIFMSDAKDCFIKNLDNSFDGIKGRMDQLNYLVKKVDPVLFERLENLRIQPQFYSLRWIMLYLTQEFELMDVLTIWDSLLTVKERNTYLNALCLGLLLSQRKQIMESEDFADALEAIVKFDNLDIFQFLQKSHQLMQKIKDIKFN